MPRRRRIRGTGTSGFTLLEILVVLVVIALLASLVGPQLVGRVSEARVTAARTELAILALALDNYQLDNAMYPTTTQGLAALRERPREGPVPANWRGPYLRKAIPLDPWGRPYVYTSPGVRHPGGYDLVTFGRDGASGGTGEDADVAAP